MLQTKIVCTVGPSCQDEAILRQMIQSGMAVARLNFSHGTHDEHAVMVEKLRRTADDLEHPLAILQDLCGPKVRIGEIPGGELPLTKGDPVVLTCRQDPGDGAVSLPFPLMINATEPGQRVLLDDGRIQLVVEEVFPTDLVCSVLVGGVLKSHKGINIPGVSFPIDSLTEKDLLDLDFGITNDVDWIAMSFVRSADDVRKLRRAIKARGASTPIISKIEKFEAVDNLSEIIMASDGIMVARGDLGVEMPIEDVPLVQKRIIRECNAVGKPVITATQMLESMIKDPFPTRAEVTDVCNAILDGTDAVMLSAETAAGANPLESVKVMARVAERTERSLKHREIFMARSLEPIDGIPHSLSEAATDIAERLNAVAIICATSTGSTPRLVARFRPRCPVIATTTNTRTWARLALSWGVRPALMRKASTFNIMLDNAVEGSLKTGLVRDGDLVIIVAGSVVETAGSTNLITVEYIGRRGHIN